MEQEQVHGQTDITKEMKFRYTSNLCVDANLPMGKKVQAMRVPNPMGLGIALNV